MSVSDSLTRRHLQHNRPGDSKLEIATNSENEATVSRGTKRYTDVSGPQPPKKKKSQGSIINGFFSLFRGLFGVSEEEDDDNGMDQQTSPSRVSNLPKADRSRSSSASSDVLCEGIVEHPEIICTSSKKTVNSVVPKQNGEAEESQEEVEIVGEIRQSPAGQLRRSQKFIEEAIKSVEAADVIQIEEQESSSDSISILSDLNYIKGQSPGPEDSVSRQNTPSRFQNEEFQIPRDTWSRRRRHRQTPRSAGGIPRVHSSTPVSKNSRFKKLTKQQRTPNSVYHTPAGITGGLLAYDRLLRQQSSKRLGAGSSPVAKRLTTKIVRPSEYTLRVKAAMKKHTSKQVSECITIEDDSSSSASFGKVLEHNGRSRSSSEAPSVSSYHSTGREKVDDLIATLQRVDLKNENVLSNYDRYKQEKKYRVHKELELKETSKQICEIRDLHSVDLAEEVRQKLYLAGIRPPLPKKKEKEEFPELPPEALTICDRAWGNGPNEEVFCEGFDTKITRKDLATLRPYKWLNDEVITFYLNLIVDRSKNEESSPKVYTFNTFFYVNISTKGYGSVKRWTRKIDIFSFDILLIPVHVGGVHWCMTVVDFGEKTIDYFDPMHHSDNGALSFIKQYLSDESMDKRKKIFDFSGWSFNERLDCPAQQNGHDCGVFSTHFAEYCARRAPLTFSQQHMDYFRRRMVYEIVTKNLL